MKILGDSFYLAFMISSMLAIVACHDSKKDNVDNEKLMTNVGDKPFLVVEKKMLDFGKIDKIKTPQKKFSIEFSNAGNSPLFVIKTNVTCGCMKVMHTKHPILKGEKGHIQVEINASNQKGYFNKSIIIESNAKNHLEIVRIKGVIE